MAPTSRIASHTKFLLRSISISFWIVAIFAPFLKLVYAHEAAAQARFAQKVAYLVSFLCGPPRIFAGSALIGPLNAETQRFAEGRREDSVTFCAKLQARLCRVSYPLASSEIGSIARPHAPADFY